MTSIIRANSFRSISRQDFTSTTTAITLFLTIRLGGGHSAWQSLSPEPKLEGSTWKSPLAMRIERLSGPQSTSRWVVKQNCAYACSISHPDEP